MWKQGQAVVRVIGGAVVERGEVASVVPAAGLAFYVWWFCNGYPAHESNDGQGRLYDAAEWDVAEAQREQATRERISETAERAEVRRRLRDVLALLPPERLAVLADELEREARGER